MKRFAFLSLLGLLQLLGVMVGSGTLQGIGAGLGASPRPKVFAMADGLETFSSRFFLESDGNCIEVTPELTGALKGPYNRRNVFGVLLAYDSDWYLIDIGRLRDGGCWFARCDEANSLCTIREEQRTNPAPPARGMANQVGSNLSLRAGTTVQARTEAALPGSG